MRPARPRPGREPPHGVEELLIAQNWKKGENVAIDHFCRNFCKRSELLAISHNQPSLVPFLELEDSHLLNENIEGEVFDIDKKPENLIRARITKYDICNNVFEIDTACLDVWDDGHKINYWQQPGIRLNEHLKNGNATHVSNPMLLPRMRDIQRGIIFDDGVHGQNLEIKGARSARWMKSTVVTNYADGVPALANTHLLKFDHRGREEEHWVNLRQCLEANALRQEGSTHVLLRLKKCLSALSSPSESCEVYARQGMTDT